MRKFLKLFISKSTADKVRLLLAKLDESIIPLFAKSRVLSSFYYLVFSRQFHREHQSVLKGRLAYKRSLSEITNSSVLLRRNTHRLEKGLIMQPRRDVFALAYIGETVECYGKCASSVSICQEEMKWATDVLNEYFSVVKLNEKLSTLKAQYESYRDASTCSEANLVQSQYVPYSEDERPQIDVDSASLLSLFKRRRSVRWYLDKEVSNDNVEQAMTMASLAPSACNRQPFEFYRLKGDDAVAIAKLAMGTAGFAENIPNLFVVVGDLSAYPAERDKHVIYIDSSLASMQLMLAFETMGISTCPINWPDIEFREKLLAKKLNLKPYQRPIMLMSFGYADTQGKIPFSQKKTPEQLIKEVTL